MTEILLVSIAIATFKRPILLNELLKSLFKQNLKENIHLEIIVVDNDKEFSAKNVVESFLDTKNITVRYYNQPIKNISLTRNLGIQNSTGTYIAFIDDDETADKDWVVNLVTAIQSFSADVVFGYVEPKFEGHAPSWLKQRELFFKPLGKTGTEPEFWYTTNCLIKSEIVKKNRILFETKRGLSGGEDGLFFRTLKVKFNAKYICCREAITSELVPLKRLNTKYLCSRNFQIGNLYAKRKKVETTNRYLNGWLTLLLRFVLAFSIYFFKSLMLYPIKRIWIFNYVKLCAAAGKISGLFNYNYEHYKLFE